MSLASPSSARTLITEPTQRLSSNCVSTQPLEVQPMRLLVVDDSLLSRKMLVRLLTSKDHVCEQAEDGEVAVQKYLEMVERGEPPEAILMDFEMPVMNGPTATARLRELGCACLILGVTGNVLPHDVAHFLAQGADAVLPKPVMSEDLQQLLARGRVLDAGVAGDTGVVVALRRSVKGEWSRGGATSRKNIRGDKVAAVVAAQ
jgi:CheY-like chemotaxis protein